MTYWQRRQKEQLKALEKSEKALMQRLTEYYRDEYAKLDKEIASFYSKYGVKNIIEYRMLLDDLSPQDRSLLIKNVEEFKKKYPELKHIVPVRENIYKLNRLEGLQLSIIMQQAEIGAVNEQAVRRHLENLALKNANSVAEFLGFGKNFYFENSDIIKNFVGVKWCDGKNFSQRIWENTDKLARYLTTDLAQGFARGESYEKLTTQIGKRFIDVAKRDIYRLVYTEGTYIMAESSAKPFEEDFESYRLSTVGDGKVCSKCNGTAESVFRFADRQAGVNFPPLHPMCRCTFEIVVDDWNKWLDDYEKKHSDSGKQIENRLRRGAENEESKKKYDYEDTIVNEKNINSATYRRRIDNITNNTEVNRSIWNVARDMLLHRSGTKFEDLAYIDSNTGKYIVNNSFDKESCVNPTKKMNKMLKNANDYTIIGVHNHPGSSVPSIGDILACVKRKYKCGIVVCHDGKIYQYSITEEKFNKIICNYALERMEKEGYTDSVKNMFIDIGVEMKVL